MSGSAPITPSIMAKKPKQLSIDEETEGFAYLLSYVAAGLNPKINKSDTFNLFSELLARAMDDDPISESEAIEYGKKMARTENGPDKPSRMH